MDVHHGHNSVGSNGTLVFEVTDDELAKFSHPGSSGSSSSSGSKNGSIINEQAKPANNSDLAGIEGYDPKRIPTSIFSVKPTNAADWSVASNESLFSIHMGNNSFSRDHFFAMYKSGELPRLDECANVVPKLQTVMEADNAGRDSTATEHESEHSPGKGERAAQLLSSEASLQIPDRKLSQDKLSSSRNSNSSTVSFQYLLTENNKGENSPSVRTVKGNETPYYTERHRQQLEEVRPEPVPAKSKSITRRSWFGSLRCCCMGQFPR